MAFSDERTIKDIEQDIYEPYALEYYEKQSLDEIKRGLENQYYIDIRIIKDHMDFLEHLLFKLNHIRNEEQTGGNLTKELDKDVFKIKGLLNQLSALHRSNAS